jgi:glyoxylase-like metal-dependent hydrolase (beta-lactamase superfamily II)
LEIADGVHLILNPHRDYFVSSCLIVDEGLTIIDAGRPESPEASIYPYIRRLGRDPSEISLVVLTHAHWDHCGGVARLKEASDCRVAVHENGRAYLEEPGFIETELAERFPELPAEDMGFDVVKADLVFRDGDKLDLDNRSLNVVSTPGHSACSSCIVDEGQGVFVAGDSVQGRGENRPLLFHDAGAYLESMNRLLETPIRTMVNGHPFPPSGKAVLRGEQVREHIMESIVAIEELRKAVEGTLDRMKEPWSVAQIHREVNMARFYTVGCILEALEAEGRSRRVERGDELLWTR